MKTKNPIMANKEQISKNIKTIRCYLELNKTEFAEKTGIGSRALEFESGRFLPSIEEIIKIAELAEIKTSLIINFRLITKIEIY